MFPIKYRSIFATLAMLASPLAVSHAQYEDHCGPFCEGSTDLRYFEPVDLDLDCMPVDRDCGYIFGYDKVYWTLTADRAEIGVPGLTYPAEIPYQRNPQDDSGGLDGQLPIGLHPQPYMVSNGIRDAPPYAEFGWGDRYEFGYMADKRIYSVSVLDGPSVSSHEVYGFLPLDLGNADGEDIDGDGIIDVNQGTGIFGPPPAGQSLNPTPLEILLAPTLNGFGSVHVNFAASLDQFLGYRDYWLDVDIDADDDDLPGNRIVFIGPDGDPVLYDGIPDDINGNLGTFFIQFVDDDGDPNTDPVAVAIMQDYGDLHFFNIRFNTLQVRSNTDTQGIELMKTHVLSNRHKMVKNQNSNLQFGYGVRFFRLKDDFRFDGLTDVAGRVYSVTNTENSIVGPQIRIRAEKQVGKWNTSMDTRFMFGYNIQNVDQTNGFGDDAVPGGLNNLFFLQPTYSRYGKRADDFAPFFEMRAEVKYQLTRGLALKTGFNATYVNNITRSSQTVQYNLGTMGIGGTGEQDIFMTGISTGIEFFH